MRQDEFHSCHGQITVAVLATLATDDDNRAGRQVFERHTGMHADVLTALGLLQGLFQIELLAGDVEAQLIGGYQITRLTPPP